MSENDQPDLASLALLPDIIKRRILNSLETEQPAAVAAPHTNLSQQQPAPAASSPVLSSSPADVISSRRVNLPPLSAGACVVDGVLSPQEAKDVASAAEAWLAAHGRRPGMGSSSSGGLWHDPQHRGDITSWVTVQELQQAGQPLLAAVLELLASLRQQLGQQGFDVSGRCSVQIACYPGAGARYVRHADASDALPDRTVTALLYLNADWDAQRDGGQLALYNSSHNTHTSSSSSSPATPAGYQAGEPALLVSPLAGRLLVFDSRLQHEVLPAQRHRYSISAFFYRPRPQAAAATNHITASSATAAQTAGGTALQPAASAEKDAVVPGAVQRQAAAGSTVDDIQQAAMSFADLTIGRTSSSSIKDSASASTGTSIAGSASRIFVSIAAFRDEECQWTLRDLFLKAAHPERVFVGVVWQIDPQADAGFVRMAGGERTATYQLQVREVRLHYHTATGPCAARSMAQRLWAGEEYVLQIDAHMRFVQDWDRLCLQQLAMAQQAAGSSRVVLSTYPLGYEGQGPAAVVPEHAPATLLCAKGFDEAGMLRIRSRSLCCRPPGPLPSYFWAAGFSFSPASWLLEVPYCPHLPHLFFGEESYMLARMVTRGWQVWAPALPLVFHQWERSARGSSYQACMKVDSQARAASQARVLQLLQQQGGSQNITTDRTEQAMAHAAHPLTDADWMPGGVWGLGTVSTMQQFEEQCGVHFKDMLLEERALYGGQEASAFVE